MRTYIICVAFCVFAQAAHAGEVRFQSPHTIANGLPIYISQGDFNKDGHPDLLVAGFPESGGSGVFLYQGLGNGSFSQPAEILEADWLRLAIPGDFNNDGNLDVAVLTAPSDSAATLTILLGNGDGTFQAPVSTPAPNGSLTMVVGDFNNDGKLDIAVVGGAQQLQVFLGNGDGSFSSPVLTSLSGNADALVAADFNQDGNLDIALDLPNSAGSASSVLILPGNGTGGFGSSSTLNLTGGPFILAAGYLNQDQDPDLVAAAKGTSSVSILLGNGDGTFQPAVSHNLSRFPSSILIDDINGDGKQDLLVSCADYNSTVGGEIAFLAGNGDGTFQAPAYSLAGIDALVSVVGLYGGTTNLDLAFVSDFSVLIAPGNGQGRFLQPATYRVGKYSQGIVAGDFNADGHPDIAATNNTGFAVLTGTGAGRFAAPLQYLQSYFFPALAVAGDFNGDGITDLVMAGSHGVFGGTPNGVQVYFGSSSGLAAGPLTTDLHVDMNSLAAVRLKPGGRLSLAFSFVAQAGHSGGVGVMRGNGDGTFSKPRLVFLTTGASGIAAADFNHDGNTDLVVGSGGGQAYILLGNGDGTFQTPVAVPVADDQFQAAASADVDGDGNPDLILTGFLYSNVYVLLGNGDGTFRPATAFPTDKAPADLVIRDFNCDGKLDVATANYNGDGVSILLGYGNGSFAPRVNFAAGSFPQGLTAGDFQGDGKPGLAVANFSSTFVSVLLNNTEVLAGSCH